MVPATLKLIGYASGIAGMPHYSGEGPVLIKEVMLHQNFKVLADWECIIKETQTIEITSIEQRLHLLCTELATKVAYLVRQGEKCCVIGGDHTAALGTWAGYVEALGKQGQLGLIWIDAHMDSHTPMTTESGRIHGMPLACLLGYGASLLTSILGIQPKFKAENICLIGVRSYEPAEAALLKKLKVKIYFMEEVQARGFSVVFNEAQEYVSHSTIGYGISLDLDALDPQDIPAVGTIAPNGIAAKDLEEAFAQSLGDPRFLGIEMVEFDPKRDQQARTQQFILRLIQSIASQHAA